MPRRMGEISTGEGKTLISALVAIYHVLRHWNEDRHVNIITSSSVLAEANIAEIGWLFQAFGVSVSNNCDQQCSNNEDVRRNRYNNDVIYGDLGSFMRDILLTRFFEDKDVTRNRNPGAIIVDEVDSLTLDKGINLY
jgi:preprotein translocase subunit SecA